MKKPEEEEIQDERPTVVIEKEQEEEKSSSPAARPQRGCIFVKFVTMPNGQKIVYLARGIIPDRE